MPRAIRRPVEVLLPPGGLNSVGGHKSIETFRRRWIEGCRARRPFNSTMHCAEYLNNNEAPFGTPDHF